MTAPVEVRERLAGRLESAEHGSVLVALLVWGIYGVHRSGGQGAQTLLVTALLLVPALLFTQPWRRLSSLALALPVLVTGGAVLVCVFAPTAWTGAGTAASYAIAAGYALVVMAWTSGAGQLSSPHRRVALAVVVVVVGLEQMTQGLLEWWGGADPSLAMSGTLGWRNQFAIFLLAPVLLGLSAAITGRRILSIVGWISAPLGFACVVLASSRATLGLLVVGWLLCGAVLCSGAEDRRRRVGRFAALCAIAVGLTFLLPGPPLFSHRASPLAATDQRSAAGETVATNTGYRLQFWEEALDVGLHHPVSGGGFGSLGLAAPSYVPGSYAISSQAHNGFLQAFSDGGLLLGLPVAAGAGALLIAAARACRRRGDPERALSQAAAIGVVALLAHAGLDFDWDRPSLMVMPVLLVGICGVGSTRRVGRGLPSTSIAGVALVAALALLTSAVQLHADQALTSAVRAEDPTTALAALTRSVFFDDRAAAALLGSTYLTRPEAQAAISSSTELARIDPRVAISRAMVQHRFNWSNSEVQAAYQRGLTLASKRPAAVLAVAPLAHVLGRDDQVRPILIGQLVAALKAENAELVGLYAPAVVASSDPATGTCVNSVSVDRPVPACLTALAGSRP